MAGVVFGLDLRCCSACYAIGMANQGKKDLFVGHALSGRAPVAPADHSNFDRGSSIVFPDAGSNRFGGLPSIVGAWHRRGGVSGEFVLENQPPFGGDGHINSICIVGIPGCVTTPHGGFGSDLCRDYAGNRLRSFQIESPQPSPVGGGMDGGLCH